MTPTPRLVIDSWAWLELFSGSEKGKSVDRAIGDAAEVYTTGITLAEVVSTAARRGRPTEDKIQAIRSQSKVTVASSEDAIEAGTIHAQIKEKVPNFSLADAFVLQAAKRLGAKVLTGDPDFRGIKEAEFVG